MLVDINTLSGVAKNWVNSALMGEPVHFVKNGEVVLSMNTVLHESSMARGNQPIQSNHDNKSGFGMLKTDLMVDDTDFDVSMFAKKANTLQLQLKIIVSDT